MEKKNKVIKLGKLSGCTEGMDENISKYTHLSPIADCVTLCGLTEEEFEDTIEIIGKLTCPDCIEIVKIVKDYLGKK